MKLIILNIVNSRIQSLNYEKNPERLNFNSTVCLLYNSKEPLFTEDAQQAGNVHQITRGAVECDV